MINAKKKCSQYDNMDIPALCMKYAAHVYDFAGLDDMDILISGKYIKDGIVYNTYSDRSHGQDGSCVYLNYLLDALQFMCINNIDLSCAVVSFRDDKSANYAKYIKELYGNKYEIDGKLIKSALCQSSNFLISAWETITANKEMKQSFKDYIKSIYY